MHNFYVFGGVIHSVESSEAVLYEMVETGCVVDFIIFQNFCIYLSGYSGSMRMVGVALENW